MIEFINQLPEYAGIFFLMLGSFLIGYLASHFFQRRYYRSQLKKIKRQSELKKTPSKVADIDSIFTEIKPKIIEVVKETREQEQPREEVPEPSNEAKRVKSGQEIAENARSSYLNYTKKKPELNFENFGYGSPSEKEDLTQINGIGPYIEQRLNEIGVYNYDQISRFKDEDIEVLTELIDFFPGRIERDNWIGQASALKKH